MPGTVESRRYALLELLAERPDGLTLEEAADVLEVDDRTVRRDVEQLQNLLASVQEVQLVRGRIYATTDGLLRKVPEDEEAAAAKARMAGAAVQRIPDGSAVLLTAGSSTHAVAVELRRRQVLNEPPQGLIVFTNSLPALVQLAAAGISTGVVGEVYNPVDAAFHSHEYRSRFQASLAIVGASGIVPDPASGTVSLCSDRVEEAAFMRQLLQSVPEIMVVARAAKIGKRHPWSFTSDGLLVGKSLHLVTTPLSPAQRESLTATADAARRFGTTISYGEVSLCAE